ncbi:hypothetical protein N0V90_006959 [Kalmusia sp. IMI 367209]|nr:hypothetical protein N0V90_006959 [Kalmusia sp. IMI 367209]
MGCAGSRKLPQIVLFGDSLTQWGFDAATQGFGWHLENVYEGKAEIVNEVVTTSYTSNYIQREFTRLISQLTSASAQPTLLFTIFLGANDACFVGKTEYVPLPRFSDNIRGFVEEILIRDELPRTKIVLITPPPIDIPEALPDDVVGPWAANEDPKSEKGYRTYVSYLHGQLSIVGEYADTGRVIGLDYWGALIDAGLEEQGRSEDRGVDEKLPGCGLQGAREFGKGWFTDGLHLDVKAYNVLSKSLMDAVVGKWPELSPERIAA